MFSKDNRVRAGEFKVATLDLTSASATRARDTGVHFVQRVHLPPGAYEIRLAANQPEGGAGSVVAPLDVPAFDEPLAISGVTLGTSSSATQLMLMDDVPLREALGGPPTSIRRFRSADTLAAYVELYSDDRAVTAADLSVRAAIVKDTGLDLKAENATAVGGPSGEPRRMRFLARLALDGLEAGKYVLDVEGRGTRRQGQPVRRLIPFEIIP